MIEYDMEIADNPSFVHGRFVTRRVFLLYFMGYPAISQVERRLELLDELEVENLH